MEHSTCANKTIVVSVAIIAIAVVTIFYFYFSSNMAKVPMDKFTTCIKTVMGESRESSKPISGKEASDICVNMFMKYK